MMTAQTRKKKFKLILDEEIDFEMIGLCTHHNDYRLVWGINGVTGIRLEKSSEEYCVRNVKGEIHSKHPMYYYQDTENRTDFYLIRNKNEGRLLIPEKPGIDFFLFLINNVGTDTDKLISGLRDVPSILGVYPFDPNALESAVKLEFN